MKKGISLYHMVIVALRAALTCVLGPLAIPLPFSPVPISLTQIPIFLAVYLLGWKYGTLSYVIYYLLGLVGLPVFSGGAGGMAKAAGPTGGYLLGFILMAIVAGLFIEKSKGKKGYCVIGMVLGDACAYLFGTPWLCYQMNLTLPQGFAAGVFPYLPGDAVKIIACAIIGPVLKKALDHVMMEHGQI